MEGVGIQSLVHELLQAVRCQQGCSPVSMWPVWECARLQCNHDAHLVVFGQV